ncbi:hypothetical protein CCMA1212_003142 [Trichoderma ghanense]|uniref:Uncharacterized protein n=1 Tax=Trichoderma ghanense TaxID=65468 RepID=A0ABY2H8P5_9HYPO
MSASAAAGARAGTGSSADDIQAHGCPSTLLCWRRSSWCWDLVLPVLLGLCGDRFQVPVGVDLPIWRILL